MSTGITTVAPPLIIMNIRAWYDRFTGAANLLQSPLLLVIRLFWGWQFAQTGWGKLMNLSRTSSYFESLHIPAPQVNAAMAGATECLGGLLLIVGLWSRAAALALTFTMAVAYATADKEALSVLFSDPDKFTGAAPFLFLFAALLVLAFGPGAFSIDRFVFGGSKSAKSAKPSK